MQSRYELFASSISSIYHSIQKIERNEMSKCGIKGVFAQYLAALQSHPEGLTAARLSELCDRDKAAVSRAVSEMEAQGLVVRESSAESMYRVPVRLTDTGRHAAHFVSRQAVAAVHAGGIGLKPAEREQLQKALALIAANLEKISQEGLPE